MREVLRCGDRKFLPPVFPGAPLLSLKRRVAGKFLDKRRL